MLEETANFIKNNIDLISLAVGLYSLFKSDSAKKIAEKTKKELLSKAKTNLIQDFINECTQIQNAIIQYKGKKMSESTKRDLLKHVTSIRNKKKNLKSDSIEKKIDNLQDIIDKPEDLYNATCVLVSDLNLMQQNNIFN